MIAFSLLFFFFFLLLTHFVEAIYAFGLMGVEIPPEIACVALFFAPAVLLLRKKDLPRFCLALLAGLVFAAGGLEWLLDTRGRMLVTGVGMGSFLIFLPSYLAAYRRDLSRETAPRLAMGAALGLGMVILLRTWNWGTDPVDSLPWKVLLAVLAAVGAALLLRDLPEDETAETETGYSSTPSFWKTAALSTGTVASLTMLYFAFESPNVLARWTEGDYPIIVGLCAITLALFGVLFALHIKGSLPFPRWAAAGASLLFTVFLVAAVAPHQVRFPDSPAGYPLAEPAVPGWADAALYLAVFLFPVLLLDLYLYLRELTAVKLSVRTTGGGFLVGSAFLLVMVLAQVFTTVYDYIPVVGPFFRDRFWLVILALSLVCGLPVLLTREETQGERKPAPAGFAAASVLLGAAFLSGSVFTTAEPALAGPEDDTLRVLTYNIQQGYGEDAQKRFAGQLALMRELDADIIGLQESDTNRISGGNNDLVRYFADRLNFHSYYGPKVVPGTFGIALLSRYPIEDPHTFYMYSVGEQTAAIAAEITVGETTYNVFVTHLGNDGDLVQQQAVLQESQDLENVILMGDFNFRPDTEQYRVTTDIFNDSWLLKWPTGIDDQGNNPARRIDHIFLSDGLIPLEARYLDRPESDHPAYFIDLQP